LPGWLQPNSPVFRAAQQARKKLMPGLSQPLSAGISLDLAASIQ